ncbi:hypothetical protein SAMN05444377_101120 [Flavobacterium fontis]|uniref:BNR repeat-containing family member n=1 Tax=Flavobacterium fontis TaxID=1124188 RepID=A0A1M4W054_9FLAO|nr:hypothetical protein [Flavobacterium fontis]SHE74641.1 hypothetical protein SAMN05444377_101120 [Flavobacterium fontis]
MKKLINLFSLLFLTYSSVAQDLKFKWNKSDIFKDSFKNSELYFAENDRKGGVIMIRSYDGGPFSNGYGYYFEHYDTNMKLVKEYDFNPKAEKNIKQCNVLGMISSGDKIHIIMFQYNKQEGVYQCMAMTTPFNEFNFESRELFRVESEQIKGFEVLSLSNFDEDSGASMIVNQDKTAFAITVDINNTGMETHKIVMFDNNLNKKIDHVFKKEIKDRKFEYENIDVSKDGKTLYILGKVHTKDAKKKKEGGKYEYEITRITNDSEISQTIETNTYFAPSLKAIAFEDRIACVGFYSERKDTRFKGICYFDLDPLNLTVKKSKFNPFTEQFMIDKYGENRDKELKNLIFKNITITATNDIIFNAEEYYLTPYTVFTANGGTAVRSLAHYDDIVCARINTSGEMVWARNINKREVTNYRSSFISYCTTVLGNDAYFYINAGENIYNLGQDRIQFVQTKAQKSNLFVIKLNENGGISYSKVLDNENIEVPLMVSNGVFSNRSVFILGQKGKKKQLLKVEIEN